MQAQTLQYAMFSELQLIHPLGYRVRLGDRARYCGDAGRYHSVPSSRRSSISSGLHPYVRGYNTAPTRPTIGSDGRNERR
jgi:hypothetical protein